jgi:hypothetical protein
MLFSQKTKGFFVDMTEQGVMLARTSAPNLPFVVEEIRECPANDAAALEEAIRSLQPRKSPSGYLHAAVGVSPAKRLVRRHALDLKRLKEAAYFPEVFTQQFRVEQEKYSSVVLLNAGDGGDYDLAKAAQKDVIFCGIATEDTNAIQDSLIDSGIYPERLELTSVAMLGAVVDYLNFSKSKTPTLVLELGADTTHSYIVAASGVEASRPIALGLDAMVPIVQKELGLKDEESARKLFYSNTFDFTGMGPLLDQAAPQGTPVVDRLLRGANRPVRRPGAFAATAVEAGVVGRRDRGLLGRHESGHRSGAVAPIPAGDDPRLACENCPGPPVFRAAEPDGQLQRPLRQWHSHSRRKSEAAALVLTPSWHPTSAT